ncbi:transposase [Streptomyces caeruleatus]
MLPHSRPHRSRTPRAGHGAGGRLPAARHRPRRRGLPSGDRSARARRFPARQPAALSQERWEAEIVFAELKTHQRGTRIVLSSKTPDGVLQQIWAHLLVHHALRELTVRTAATRGLDPDWASFTETLRSAPRNVPLTPGAFSP